MSNFRPPSPPHSIDGDRSKDLRSRQAVADPFTPPVNMSSMALPDYPHYDDPQLYHTAAPAPYYDQRPLYYPPRHDYTPTPPPMGYAEVGIQTRSGRSLTSPETPKRPNRAAPAKRAPKKRALKSMKNAAHTVEAPLSELTKDYSLAVRDMEAWVTRPAEERRKEAEKKNGYVSRPMNSFMLYRSAYAERVKKFCKENNHQVVSQVTGASWPLEPQPVRSHYEKLAIMERDNHQAAFPDYKFAPNKNGKKRGREEDEESDGEWGGSSRTKRSRTAASTTPRGDTPRSGTGTPFDDYYSASPYQPAMTYNPSAWDYTYHQGGPPQAMYQDHAQAYHGGYYQVPHIQQYAPGVEDLQFARVENTFPPQDQMLNNLAILPSSDGHQLLGPDDNAIGMPSTGDILDPRLGDMYALPELKGDPQFDATPRQTAFSGEAFHPGHATLTGPHNIWDDPGQAGPGFGP